MSREPGKTQLANAYRLFNEINIIAQLSANALERVMPHGLTLSQFSVLNWFARVDSVATPGRLSRAFQVSKGTMTNTLTRLAQKDFISISADPASGRRKLVRLTPAGRQAREDAIAASHPTLAAFLGHFDGRRVAALLPALEEIRVYLDAAREQDG